MLNLLITLPLQFACQLIGPINSTAANLTIVDGVTTSPEQSTILPEGYTAFPDIGLAYRFQDAAVTWNTARKLCISEGANLAVLDSMKQIQHAMTVKKSVVAPHVGIHRTFDNVEWTDVKTGLPLSTIPWAPTPDLGKAGWNCAVLLYDGSGFSAHKCDTLRSYICEIPLNKNHGSTKSISISSI